MNAKAIQFDELVKNVVISLREITPREEVELGVVHGFCVDYAQQNAPHLLGFLSHVDGLDALAAELSRMVEILQPAAVSASRWRFLEQE